MDEQQKIYPFNNNIEAGLRTLVILNSAFPNIFDIQKLIYFDYLTIHSGDFEGGLASLHTPVPNRTGELYVRKSIILEGIELYISKGLIEQVYLQSGIYYKATEESAPFLDSFSSLYMINLKERALWAIKNFVDLEEGEIKKLVERNLTNWENEYNLEILR